jgi:hypothetical protein
MAPQGSATRPEGQWVKVGSDGVKALDKNIYLNSTSHESYGLISIDSKALPTGPMEVLVSGITFGDFALAQDGTAYLSHRPQNSLISVSSAGNVRLVAREQFKTTLAGWAGVAFGNGNHIFFYVMTNVGQFAPIVGTGMKPASISFVQLRRLFSMRMDLACRISAS